MTLIGLRALLMISTLLLVLVSAAPGRILGLWLTPNIAWLGGLCVSTRAPQAWSRLWAFLLGLLQDVLFGTPLGSQALLSVFVAEYGRTSPMAALGLRQRWIHAALVFLLAHLSMGGLLWLSGTATPSFTALLGASLVSGAWYPLLDKIVRRVVPHAPL